MTAEKLTLFRGGDAPFIEDTDATTTAPMSDAVLELVGRLVAVGGTGAGSGSDTRLLHRHDGPDAMSLVHVWLKPNKPVPRHSHDVDCLYSVLAGEVVMGSQVLRPGDGFFVPARHPYAFRVGADGAEIIEFRTAATFDLQLHEESAAVWDEYVAAAVTNGDAWRAPSTPPSWRRDER